MGHHRQQHARLPYTSPSSRIQSIESMMPSNHPILCHPLPLLPSMFPSIKLFSKELALRIEWPKYWNSSFSISASNKYSGLISSKIFDLLAVQGTLKSLFYHHSLKASILWCSAFFMAQFSHPYITTGKTIALSLWTSLGKMMSLHCNVLSRFVIAFLSRRPRKKNLSLFPVFPHLFA